MYRHLPSTKALRAFVVTAQCLNITRAAAELNLTQGAVSRQLTALEEDIGVPLFARHARGLALTVAGATLLPEVVRALDNLALAIDQLSVDKNRIRLKAPSCITYWLMPKLNAFYSTFPEIDVELTSTTNHNFKFAPDVFDAAICYGKPDIPLQPNTYPLFDEVLTPLCNAETLAGRDANTFIKQLHQHPWLHASSDQRDWKYWLQQADLSGLRSDRNQHFPTLDLATSAAARGFGIVVGDINLACNELDNGRLLAPLPLHVKTGNQYFLQTSEKRHNECLVAFTEFLLAQ